MEMFSTIQMIFFGSSWNGTLAVAVDYADIRFVSRKNALVIIPDGIYILANGFELQFDGFSDREIAFRHIRDMWLQATDTCGSEVNQHT